jgi:hypothetical protein
MSKYKLGDYTVNNWNDWDRVPRDPVTVGGYILSAVAPTFVAGLSGAAALGLAYVTGFVAITAVTSWALNALMPKPPVPSYSQQVNIKEAAAPQDFVYGEIRKGGVITFYETSGNAGFPQLYLHQIIVLAGHEVNSIGDIYINDKVATFSGNFVTTATDGTETVDYKSKIRIKKYDGSQTTADSDLVSETSVDSTFKGLGIAYLYVRYEFDQDVFSSGLPLITAKIQGKKVYDPRTTTTAYSNNAALCIRDFITSSYGLDDSAIDETSFTAAANECDENVTLDAGGTEKRYTLNGTVSAASPIGNVLGEMVTACAGTLFWGSGYWRLKAGAYTSPVKTLTLDDLRGPINLETRTNMRDNFNTVRGTFTDAEQDYIAADYPEVTSSTFKTQDNGEEALLDLNLPFTTSSATAQRLAKLTLYRGREQMTLSADFGLNAFNIEVGDIISFTNARYGFSAKEFEVIGWSFSSNQEAGDLRVRLTLQETSQAAFDWNAEETAITSNDSTLPTAFDVQTPTLDTPTTSAILNADGTAVPTIVFTWSVTTDALVDQYEFQWKKSTDTEYNSSILTGKEFTLFPAISGVTYNYRVRAFSFLGVRSAFASGSIAAPQDTTAPSDPTSFTATGGFQSIRLDWTNPTDSDLRFIRIWVTDTNVAPNYGSVTPDFTSLTDDFTHSKLGNAVTKYYWIKAEDYSGNQSGAVGSASATTLRAATDDIDTSAVTTPKIAAGAVSFKTRSTDGTAYSSGFSGSSPAPDTTYQTARDAIDNGTYPTGAGWKQLGSESYTVSATDVPESLVFTTRYIAAFTSFIADTGASGYNASVAQLARSSYSLRLTRTRSATTTELQNVGHDIGFMFFGGGFPFSSGQGMGPTSRQFFVTDVQASDVFTIEAYLHWYSGGDSNQAAHQMQHGFRYFELTTEGYYR